MAFYNHVTLIGNLGKDPEVLKKTDHGPFIRCSLATSRRFTGPDGQTQDITQWHTIMANGRLGERMMQYLKKGDRAMVVGELRYEKWQDRDGVTHESAKIYASEVKFLSPKSAVSEDDAPKEPLSSREATPSAATALDVVAEDDFA